jgi:hypothetical protein
MRPDKDQSPMWEAPVTLLPRVMAAIESGRAVKPVPFFTWSLPLRMAIVVLAGVLLGVGLLFINELLNTAQRMAGPVIADLMHGLNAAWTLVIVFESIMKGVTPSVTVLFFLAVVGMMMTLVWLGTVAGFVYIMREGRQGRMI